MTKRRTMKQAVLMGKGGPWEIREVEIPKAGPNELLIKVKASTICTQTDLNSIKALHPPHDHQMQGMLPHHCRIWDKRVPDELSDVYPKRMYPNEPFPTTMGHEAAGEVVAVGEYTQSGLDELSSIDSNIKVGDRVSGLPTVGGFGEYIIMNRDSVMKLPDNMDYEEGSMVEPVFMVYNTVRQVVQLGDTVAVIGQGALGLIATQVAKVMGAKNLIVSEPVESKRKLAKELGADITIDPGEKNVVHEIERLTDGLGVDTAIEAAGEPESIRILPYIMKTGGRIGQIGACCVPVTIDWSYIHFRGLMVTSEIHMLVHGNFKEILQRSISLISSGKVDVKPLITNRYKLEDVAEAFQVLEKDRSIIKSIFIFK
jgi:2-desacetyl-2-hydroxyethyl bacteriochlorophyllide A dehydrogenase